MSPIRVQIHLKYMNVNSSNVFHNFWYAFDPSRLLTVNDVINDIRLNYLKDQISLAIDEQQEQNFIIHLDECQLLPFTSSQVLRDDDRLIFTPLKQYKLSNKSLQDSVLLNMSSSMSIDPSPLSEINRKRQRIESVEEKLPLESTITISNSAEPIIEPTSKKKRKSKSVIEECTTPSTIQGISETMIVQTTAPIPKETIIEKEVSSEMPLSVSSTNARIRELKSKTPTWKSVKPVSKGNVQGKTPTHTLDDNVYAFAATLDKAHIRFDSDDDEEQSPKIETTKEATSVTKVMSPSINISINSIRLDDTSKPELVDKIATKNISDSKKRTVDLLFDMKQHKTPQERIGKKIQREFGRKRAQHRKRTLDYFSMANFVDQAFGLDKDELMQQITPKENQTSTPVSLISTAIQSLPTSFTKLARLPLVAEAIDNNDKIYDLYPPVTQYPSVRTRIAFKLLELGHDFCPTMSAFKEGIVIDANQTTGELTIQLDKPLDSVFDQPSKFYAPSDEQSDEHASIIVLPFSDLNSVRLLTKSNNSISQ